MLSQIKFFFGTVTQPFAFLSSKNSVFTIKSNFTILQSMK